MGHSDTIELYDSIASAYHELFKDWEASVARHGAVVDETLRGLGLVPASARLLDVACGIGTQSIGLAVLGWSIGASDASPEAVNRAKCEFDGRGLDVPTQVADMRRLQLSYEDGIADAVIAFDNSVAHLLTEDDLDAFLRGVGVISSSGGKFVASIRDYDAIRAGVDAESGLRTDDFGRMIQHGSWYSDLPSATVPAVHSSDLGRTISFQLWTWAPDLKSIEIDLYMIREKQRGVRVVEASQMTVRALGRQELFDALARNGFSNIRWHTPAETGFYQPIVSATSSSKE